MGSCYEGKCNEGSIPANIPISELKNPKDQKDFKQKLFISELSDNGENVEVSICGQIIENSELGKYIHHCLVLKCLTQRFKNGFIYIIFDWDKPTDKFPTAFKQTIKKTDKLFVCKNITGTFPLYEIRQKCLDISRNKQFEILSYNSNNWISDIYENLTKNKINLDYNCSCVNNPLNNLGPINTTF